MSTSTTLANGMNIKDQPASKLNGINAKDKQRASLISTEISEKEEVFVLKKARIKRENQQIFIYIFVSVTIIAAWFVGTYNLSFLWPFGLVVLVLVVWKTKVMTLVEEFLRDKELEVHRRRALRQSETTEWLNFIINRWWVFSESSITELVKRHLDPVLIDTIKPAFVSSIELESFTLGSKTPYIKHLRVFETSEAGPGGGRRAMSWSSIAMPPSGLRQASRFQVVLETTVGLQSDEFLMILRTKLGGKWLGMTLDVAVEKLNLNGQMQIILNMNMDCPFPHVSDATLSFIETPEVWFNVRFLKTVSLMEIPVLREWIHKFVMSGLTEAIVDPGSIEINMESTGPTKIPSKVQSKVFAQGVLTMTISCEYQKADDNEKKGRKNSGHPALHLENVEDLRHCNVMIAGQTYRTGLTQGTAHWNETCSFLVYSLQADKIVIEMKSKIMLTDRTLVGFEIPVSTLQLAQRGSVVEKRERKLDGGETVKLSFSMIFTPLENIGKSIEDGTLRNVDSTDIASGVLYICVHGASDLLGLDPNGFSDPYCFIYNGGKKVKSTHYVPRTKNPRWDVTAEIIVEDVTKTMLSFVVYDWDGRSVSEDDFLGSAHILLSLDQPSLVRKKLNLGYNLLNLSVDEPAASLGKICVTVVFKPVSSISTNNRQEQLITRRVSIPADAVKLRDFGDGPAMSYLAPHMEEILEINIIQAKDLVAMDRNGFSDPYCEVKVGGKRKFATEIKKKTLTPIWDASVTLPLITPPQTLEILVYDHDIFMQKDFLGSLTFTLDDLKKLSLDKQHDGWHALTRIRAGSIQLKFRIPSMDVDTDSIHHMLPNQRECSSMCAPTSAVGDHHPGSILKSPAVSNGSSDNHHPQKQPHHRSHQHHNSMPDRESDNRLPVDQAVFRTSSPMRRTASDAKLKESSLVNDSEARSHTMSSKMGKASSVMMLASGANLSYFGVTGQLLDIKGLADPALLIYCKVRLVSDNTGIRKSMSSGRVIAKSGMFLPAQMSTLKFEVDQGQGVRRKAGIVFDVKSGHFSHVAMRAYTFYELFGDETQEVERWLNLDASVQIKVRLSYVDMHDAVGSSESCETPRKSRSFLGTLRPRGFLKKVDEQ